MHHALMPLQHAERRGIQMIHMYAPGPNNGLTPNGLTPREAAVLELIIQGATSRSAGITLGISSRTVEFHRANIMQKLSAKNVADLMRIVLSGQ
jgi:FixJ family two-component response regulator